MLEKVVNSYNSLNMNPTEFELFTRHVYQKLVNNDVLKPTLVQHNVKLKGKSACEHQIDVYWEYEIAGCLHRVAIECKNYNSPVEIGNVRDFKGVLDDLNNVNGIMVSAQGYQSGAKKYAEQYGILLKELRTPNWRDTIGELVLRFHSEIRHCFFLIDEESAAKKGFDLQRYREFHASMCFDNADKWHNATHLPLPTKDNIIRNAKGKQITTLDELEKQLPNNLKPNSSYVFPFEDAWIDTLHWGLLKIQEVKYEYESKDTERVIGLAADMFVEAILKDAISGEIQYVRRR